MNVNMAGIILWSCQWESAEREQCSGEYMLSEEDSHELQIMTAVQISNLAFPSRMWPLSAFTQEA